MNFRDLNQLRLFLEAYLSNSLDRAGENLRVTQAVATHAIDDIERECGGPVYDRDKEGFHLTSQGLAFVGRMTNFFDILDPALDAFSPNLKLGIEISQLRSLAAVHEAGDFALAASQLALSEETVRHAVEHLERDADGKLFESTSFGMISSPRTIALVRAIRLAFLELDQAEVEFVESDVKQAGRIVIGVEPLFRSVLLPKALSGFWKIRPRFPVQVIDGSYGELLGGLQCGDIDLILGELRYPEPDDEVVQERLIYDRLAIIAGKHHPLADKPGVSDEELLSFGWIAPPQGTPSRERFEGLFGGEQIPESVMETNSILLMRDILADGDLLGCISNVQAQIEISRGTINEIDADTARTGWPVGLSHRRKWSPTLSQDYFLQQLREESFEDYEEETRRNLLAKT